MVFGIPTTILAQEFSNNEFAAGKLNIDSGRVVCQAANVLVAQCVTATEEGIKNSSPNKIMDKERGKRPDQFTLEDITRLAREKALEFSGHVPTILAEGSQSSRVAELATMPDTFEDKVHLLLSAGFAFGQSGEVGELKQVFFISEGWMSIADKGKPPEMRPSEDPNRKEVLLISNLVIQEQRNRMVILEMVRDVEGHLFDLKELELLEDAEEGKFENPLLDAFVEGFLLGRGRLN